MFSVHLLTITQKIHIKLSFKRGLGGDFIKVMELEAWGPPSSLEYIGSTIYGQIPIVRNLETSCKTPVPGESAKPATLKWLGKIETPSDHNPIPDTAPYNRKKPPAPSFSLGERKELNCKSMFQLFWGLFKILFLSYLSWHTDGTWHVLGTLGSVRTKMVVSMSMETVTITPPSGSTSSKQVKNPRSQLLHG